MLYGPKNGYRTFVGARGTLDSRLRNVIAYKRTSMVTKKILVDEDIGMTRNEEIALKR